MAGKHIPGPYAFDPDEGTIESVDGVQLASMSSPEDFPCRDTDKDAEFEGELIATAQLFAAAPDLLAEMKRLSRGYVTLLETGRDHIVANGGTCDPVDVMEAGDPVLRAARATIAKAEGRT